MSCFTCLVFSCVYCFFLKRLNLYIDIYSAWISRTSAQIFFSQLDVINVSKTQQIYCYFTENNSMNFWKVIIKTQLLYAFPILIFTLFTSLINIAPPEKLCWEFPVPPLKLFFGHHVLLVKWNIRFVKDTTCSWR